jgi:small subunit ribosomal protein S2
MDEKQELEGMGGTELLVEQDTYLACGVHIGTRQKTGSMTPYIFKVRPDRIYILDVRKTDAKIRVAAKMLAREKPERILVVSARQYGQQPVLKFCEVVGAKPMVGRFIPGTLTNPSYPGYSEFSLLLITDPMADSQPLAEASKMGIPVIALCDTDNETADVDLVIPTNNKGKKALALVYWLLARQVLRERGELAPDASFSIPLEEFESRPKEVPE